MTASILHFTPRAELDPQANLDAFIDLCRQSDVLNARAQFDLNVWDIGHLKGQNSAHRAVFSTTEAASLAKPAPEPALPQPFLNFAKAVLVYLHDKKPVVSQAVRVSALRFLEAALREWSKGARPTAVNEDVLESAVALAQKTVSPGVAYRVGGQLELIADLMRSKRFILLRQQWFHGLKKPKELGSRISKEAIQARQEKLPSAAVLRALGGIFYEAVEPVDVMVSSHTALMLCAPDRINEVLRLPRRCVVHGDGRFAGEVGLRWAGSKGAEDTTKWLPTQMVEIAQEAVSNIEQVSAPARRIAAWYTTNRTSLFLHEGVEHLRDREVLTVNELALVLWGNENAGSASRWARETANLEPVPLGSRAIGYRFVEVERAVLAMLPATFPHVPGDPRLLCSEALSLSRDNEFHSTKATWLCMFSYFDNGGLRRHYGLPGRESVFERFNYTEDDGTPIRLRSHSLRHYLNMLAQVGGLSSAEIAIFSGRKDSKHNRDYDHESSDEVQAPISEALKAGLTAGLVAPGLRQLVTRSEFKGLGLLAAHTSEYGRCNHNFASEPCQLYRDCINCEEHECVKGEHHKEQNLRQQKAETEYLLKQAREALNEEEYGADIWVQHQTKTLERVDALLAIFDNPEVPAGARIRLDLEGAPLIMADNVKPVKFLRRDRKTLQ